MPQELANCSVCCCSTTNKILMVVFMISLILAILFGNLLTLAVVVGTKHFHTPQGYLKASLAVADLAVGMFCGACFRLRRSISHDLQFNARVDSAQFPNHTSPPVQFHRTCVCGMHFSFHYNNFPPDH